MSQAHPQEGAKATCPDCPDCTRHEAHDPTAQPSHFPGSPKMRRMSLTSSSHTAPGPGSSSQATGQDLEPPHIEAEGPSIVIEFCNRCRWLHRATWVQTELFLTFDQQLSSITLVPRTAPETGGRWRVWLKPESAATASAKPVCVWDRKTEGGFGELKELKQRIRDVLQPEKSLGHSDKPAA